MEICGGHTHAIFRYGLDRLTPAGMVRQAALARLSKDSDSLIGMLQKGSDMSRYVL